MKTDDKEFEQRSRDVLQSGVEGLDGRIRSRLTQARFAAVEEARKARAGFAWRNWVPAGGLAAAALLAVVLWDARPTEESASAPTSPSIVPSVASPMDDLELLAAADGFELLEEDLEFYVWVESEPDIGAGVG
jgi:hypothetical protein